MSDFVVPMSFTKSFLSISSKAVWKKSSSSSNWDVDNPHMFRKEKTLNRNFPAFIIFFWSLLKEGKYALRYGAHCLSIKNKDCVASLSGIHSASETSEKWRIEKEPSYVCMFGWSWYKCAHTYLYVVVQARKWELDDPYIFWMESEKK